MSSVELSLSDRKIRRFLEESLINCVNSATQRKLGNVDVSSFSELLNSQKVSVASLLTALIFIERFKSLEPKPILSREATATDLIIVAAMLASKFLYDDDTELGVYNAEWAEEFHMDIKTLNRLEVRFLSALNWNCFVSPKHLTNYIYEHSNYRNKKSLRPLKESSIRHHHVKSSWHIAKAVAVFTMTYLAMSQTSPISRIIIKTLPIRLRIGQLTLAEIFSIVTFVRNPQESSYSRLTDRPLYENGTSLLKPGQSNTFLNSSNPRIYSNSSFNQISSLSISPFSTQSMAFLKVLCNKLVLIS